jgi:hypothetical protein
MAGKKITELSSSIAPSLTGVTAVAFGGTTYKSTLSTLRQILVDSGSHRFTGSQFISGSLSLTGSMPNLTVGSGTYHVDNPEILHVQNSGSYNIAHFESNNQYYAQVNIKNTNSGNNSSTDLVASADNGTEGVHYVNMGINSSTYTGGYVGLANDAYLINVGKDLYVGTVGGLNHPAELKLFAQNSWERPQITIHTGSQVTFNTLTFTEGYTYEFSGSVKLNHNLKTSGSVQITGSLNVTGSANVNGSNIMSSNTVNKLETITSASYASIIPVSGTLYIIIN